LALTRSLLLVALVLTASTVSAEEPPLSPSGFYELRAQARQQMRDGQWTEAVPLLEKLVEAAPEDRLLRYWLGTSLFRSGQEGMPHLLEAYDAGYGSEPEVAYLFARGLAQAGEGERALEWLDRALVSRYKSRPQLQTDDAFASLEANAAFRRLAGFLPKDVDGHEAGWRQDLSFFLEETRRLHAAPERPAESAAFAAALATLEGRVSELSSTEIAVELQKIVASLGDGHSVLYPMPTERVPFEYLPLSFYFFSDGLFIVGTSDEAHASLIGSRVVAMGGKSTETLLDDMRPYVSRDNDQGLRWIGPRYLTVTPMLKAMGYTESTSLVRLTLEDSDGATRAVEVGAAMPVHGDKLGPPPGLAGKPPLWLRDVRETYWHEPLPELDALYVQFNQVRDQDDGPSIADYAKTVQAELEKSELPNLILDLRHNNGGNNFLIWPIVRLLVFHELSGDDHQVWVITGRNTFSACQNLINFIERVTDRAVFVGEPSSSRTNFTGEDTDVQLPYSGLELSISSRYWQDSYPGDRRPYISVAMPVELSSADYFGGHDPVLEALAEVLTSE
jgi:hypothetical protein